MKNKYKAILTDFDNTLVGKDCIIHPDLRKKIMEITGNGIIFSIATGRPYTGVIQSTCKELELQSLQITWGGAYIIDAHTEQPVWEEVIPDSLATRLISFLLDKKIQLAIEMPDANYTNDGKRLYFFSPQLPVRKINDLEINSVAKVLVLAIRNAMNETQAATLAKELTAQFKELSIIYFKSHSGYYGIDITSEKATKHTAVLEYMRLLNLKPEQVVGIGDGLNDYPLLTACGYKIAMGDAVAELKEIADYITLPQKENGLLNALDHVFG